MVAIGTAAEASSPRSDASGRTVNWQLMYRLHDINPPMDAPHFNGSTDPVTGAC